MKHLAKFQIKGITGIVFVFFLLTNIPVSFAQGNRNTDRSQRVFQTQNTIEVVKLPNPNEPDLLSVTVSDDQLFIGGRNGVLRYYDIPPQGNFGAPIEIGMAKVSRPIRQVFFRNEIGYSVRGNIIYNTNRNGTWAQNYQYLIGNNLSPEFWSMDFADSNSACVVGVNLKKSGTKEVVDSGLIICNHDFKNNSKVWIPPTLPDDFNDGKINSQLTSISFDGNKGWVVGANGIIWKTENGGKTWQSEESKIENPLLSVYAVDADNVWSVGFNSTILHRGKSKSNNPKPNRNRQNQRQPDKRGNTENDQKKEENKSTQETLKEKGKVAIDDLRNGRIPTFGTPTPTPTPTPTKSPAPTPTPKTAQIENETENLDQEVPEETGKAEWLALEDKNPLGSQPVKLWAVKFAPDKQNGWIIGDSGVILHTANGGIKWDRVGLVDAQKQPLFKTTAPNFYAMHIDNNFCWIVGSQGVILRMRY